MSSKRGGKKFKKNRAGPKYVQSAEEIESRDNIVAVQGKMSAALPFVRLTGAGAEKARAERRAAAEDDDSEEEVQKVKGGMASLGLKTKNPNAKGFDHDGLTKKQEKELEARRKAAAERVSQNSEQARSDLKRLEEVKKRREQQRKAKLEQEEKRKKMEEEAAAKASAAKKNSKDDGSIPKLDMRAIKKMKPAQMKEALKERGLSTQGNKNELMKRLAEAQ